MKTFLALVLTTQAINLLTAETPCVEPCALAKSTVYMARYFDEELLKVRPQDGIVGVAGTGWFFESDRQLVTASHVAEGMLLSTNSWSAILVIQSNEEGKPFRTNALAVRIIQILPLSSDGIAILELNHPCKEALTLKLRKTPLAVGEKVSGIGHSNERMRFAKGRLVRKESEDNANKRLASFLSFEFADGSDRLALDFGSSGGPILDCDGLVVAILGQALSQELKLKLPFEIEGRTSTPWGEPNNTGIPASALKNLENKK